ncbi:hypothetical protein BX600DRAFT_443719 [Xylariales sp. PMI_506]|nr:hypothetical protein BX600DRAFT_443719 [Xylariales sp. PMI_506]
MKFFAVPTFVATLALLASHAQAEEVVYLSNCYTLGEYNSFSIVNYYADVSASQNGQVPSDANQCQKTTNGDVTWELGGTDGCTFPTGVTFQWTIELGAASLSTGEYAGYGWNGYNGFICYRDNGRQLFQKVLEVCDSIYYCLQ